MLEFFRAGGFNMFVLLALGIPTWITAVKFARNATPQRLSLVRALTIAVVFASIVGVASGFASTAHYVVEHEPKEPLPILLQGFAETLTNAILGGGIVVITWILVAVGVRRMPALSSET
jgi:hypothetical protein